MVLPWHALLRVGPCAVALIGHSANWVGHVAHIFSATNAAHTTCLDCAKLDAEVHNAVGCEIGDLCIALGDNGNVFLQWNVKWVANEFALGIVFEPLAISGCEPSMDLSHLQ